MAENSKIEWTDHTFNPWLGCTKVGPGCDHCYAESWGKRCKCGKKADRECDWKVMKRGKAGTCDKGVCSSCSVSPAPEKDLCQKHAAMWSVDPRNQTRKGPVDVHQVWELAALAVPARGALLDRAEHGTP